VIGDDSAQCQIDMEIIIVAERILRYLVIRRGVIASTAVYLALLSTPSSSSLLFFFHILDILVRLFHLSHISAIPTLSHQNIGKN
jgi:hypothetical protein